MGLRSKQPTTRLQATCLHLTLLRMQIHFPPSAFIRRLSLQYKRQDRNSERIPSVLCGNTLPVKGIIVVCRSPY